jgi:NitT/TauT family transport system permease protein
VFTGFFIAVAIAYSKIVRDLTYPFLVAAQILPKIAFAPLFLIWFGFGLTPKVVIAALIAFFPIVINTAKGLTSVDSELLQYMDSLGANAWEKFTKISLPWAMPYFFAALKISITLAIVGAVVGEFVAAGEGLGYVINSSNISLDTELMFAAIICMSVLGIALYLVILLLERLFLPQGSDESGVQATM